MEFNEIKLIMSDIDGTIIDDQHLVDDNLKESSISKRNYTYYERTGNY
jgi:hydroxymethylpyrimidine pyrophosphatase-like HAD family hydrolase